MNGLVEDFSPGVVIVLVAHTDEMGADGQSGNIQILGQDGFDLGIKGSVLCLKGGAVSFPGSVSTKYSAALNVASPPDDPPPPPSSAYHCVDRGWRRIHEWFGKALLPRSLLS